LAAVKTAAAATASKSNGTRLVSEGALQMKRPFIFLCIFSILRSASL
jgi:hypothetical protein